MRDKSKVTGRKRRLAFNQKGGKECLFTTPEEEDNNLVPHERRNLLREKEGLARHRQKEPGPKRTGNNNIGMASQDVPLVPNQRLL